MRWLFTLAVIPVLACASPKAPTCDEFYKVDAEPAREASDRFLTALDEGRYDASWDHMAGEVQAEFPRDTWAGKMRSQRTMLGAAESREYKGTGYITVPIKFVGESAESLNPLPWGWSLDREHPCESLPLSIYYKSSYAIAGRVSEKVLLRREGGAWRVLIYSFGQSIP